MSEPLKRFLTKATKREGEEIRHSMNWLFSRRGSLEIHEDRLCCGDWTIPFQEIDDALLFKTRGLLIGGYVLAVKTGRQIYQFGLSPTSYWEGDLPFPVRREAGRLRYSKTSLAVRIIIFLGLLYLLWTR